MKVGDQVRFRATSKAWRSRGLNPGAQGTVTDLYRAPMTRELKVDVRFGPDGVTELAILVEDMERITDEAISSFRLQ
jgi:hypothetical protein